MEIRESEKVKDLKVIRPVSFHDFRGEYLETFSAKTYQLKDHHGNDVAFVEDDSGGNRIGFSRGKKPVDETKRYFRKNRSCNNECAVEVCCNNLYLFGQFY